jgi:hypothetical protein
MYILMFCENFLNFSQSSLKMSGLFRFSSFEPLVRAVLAMVFSEFCCGSGQLRSNKEAKRFLIGEYGFSGGLGLVQKLEEANGSLAISVSK